MGLKKYKCVLCGINMIIVGIRIASGEAICDMCFRQFCKVAGLRYHSLPLSSPLYSSITSKIKMDENEIRHFMKDYLSGISLAQTFSATKRIEGYIEFDEVNEKIMVPQHETTLTGSKRLIGSTLIEYSKIVGYELLQDGESVTSGGLGAAVVGGLLFGGVGAIVGGATGSKKSSSLCTSLQVKITINDTNNPAAFVVFHSGAGIERRSERYKYLFKSAHECISILQLICESNKPVERPSNTVFVSDADEIMKYKKLVDVGAISQEEYELKKKQLLGLHETANEEKPVNAAAGENNEASPGGLPGIGGLLDALPGWGPERCIFAAEAQVSSITFNSKKNTPYGDEYNFCQIREKASNGPWQSIIEASPGNEYQIRLFIHNNAAEHLNLIAKNVRAAISLPATAGKYIDVFGFVGSDNANPSSIWSGVRLHCNSHISIAYMPNSAYLVNRLFKNGVPIHESVLTKQGALIGYNQPDGRLPGGLQYSAYLFITVLAKSEIEPYNFDLAIEGG